MEIVESEERIERREEILRGMGGRITLLREGRRWTRAELAERLGVTRQRLGMWERGSHAPPPEALADLAAELGVSIDELLTGQAPVGRLLTPDERNRIMSHLGGELDRMLRIMSDGEAEAHAGRVRWGAPR